jgi:predicted secreted hydrolase
MGTCHPARQGRQGHALRAGADHVHAEDAVDIPATGDQVWQIVPLQNDQELDSRRSTGAVYWEGAVTIQQNGRRVGRGYLEMTGYVQPMKL